MTIREELKKLVAKLGGTPSKDDQTAELIHKITDQVESGGGGGIVVNLSESGALDKTWKEIRDAFVSGGGLRSGGRRIQRYSWILFREYGLSRLTL